MHAGISYTWHETLRRWCWLQTSKIWSLSRCLLSGWTTLRPGLFNPRLSVYSMELHAVWLSLNTASSLWPRNWLSRSWRSDMTPQKQSVGNVCSDDYTPSKAITNLPRTGDMQPSSLISWIVGLLQEGYMSRFFLQGMFLKYRSPDVWAHLVYNKISDPLTLALKADKIFQSRVYSTFSAPVLGEEFPVHVVSAPAAPCSQDSRSSTPGPPHCHPKEYSTTTNTSTSPSMCWYHHFHI